MRNGLKRATALAMTILMLLALLPAALAEGTELHSDGVVPGLSDGGDLAALLDEVNAADGVASANALLAAYGGISALADGVEIDEAHYSIKVDNMPAGEDYTIVGSFFSGEVGEGTVPTVTPIAGGEPLEFVGAYINNAAVTYVGTLEHEGTTYVFYTTAENESSMAATVLGQGVKIELRYTTQEELPITYTLYAADSGWKEDQIFGADRPVAVFAGDNYNVTVRIPRGYTAEVTVNEADTFTVGEDPKYTIGPFEGNKNEFVVVPVTGSVDSLSLERLIEVTNAQRPQSIAVTLTKDTHIFSAEAVVQTRYFSSNGKPRCDYDYTVKEFESVPEGRFVQLWEFTTNLQDGVMWRLDSLQINGEQLAIPFADSPGKVPVSKTTTLSSGTVVKLTLTSMQGSNGKYTRTYTLSVSNCYEDITISGGNLNASGWTEVIPETLVGVELKIGSGNDSESWKQIDQSEPFSIGDSNDRDYQYGTRNIHFKLKNGYADPVVRYTDAAGDAIDGDWWTDSYELSGPDVRGWYHITINNVGAYADGNTFTFLHIEAKLADYMVTYDDGEEAAEPGSMPQDDTNNENYYNIVNAAQVPVSNVIPLVSDATMAFQHWELERYGEPIKPGDVLPLKDFAQYAVRQPNGKYAFPLVAVWQPAETAEYITYQVQFQKDGEDVEGELYTFQTARLATGGTTVVILEHAEEIQNFLNENPNYKLDSENVYLHNDVENGDILYVNFVKADTTVTITKRITGSMGDRQREFAFTVTSDKPFGKPEENAYSLSDDKLTASFELGHEGSVTLNVPIGAQLTITETDAKGYDVSAVVDATKLEGQDASFTLTVKGEEQVTVTNNKEARPDTGIVTDSLPYVLILACVIAVVVVVVIRGRNRHDD